MSRPILALALCSLVGPTAGCHEPGAGSDGRSGLDPEQPPIEGRCDLRSEGPSDPFADCVEGFTPAPGVSFGHEALPGIVLGPPRGEGLDMGSTDVVSLGCGGSITLAFDDPAPTDGPGPDLVVFENAFVSGATRFVEPGQVLVSEDGIDWYAFPCEPDGEDPLPSGCAGLEPVLADDEASALDPASAGGDAFDLAELGLAEIHYLRVVDRTREHYGSETWCAGASGGFDLDAVVALGAGG
ncbi:MAG: cell surface protein [Myxococcales bacterium]|nr:cell surface protein [Myxococcales bacterium]